jgi:magnesium transporter
LLHPDESIEQALARARTCPNRIIRCYVVDAEDRLVGYVPVRRLLTSPLDAPVSSVMVDDVMAIPAGRGCRVTAVDRSAAGIGKLAALARRTNVPLEAVVADIAEFPIEGTWDLVMAHGVIDYLDNAVWRTRRDSQSMAGFKDRFPWLLCNIAGGLLCAVLSSRFEELLNVAVVLALFIPVVLALAESVTSSVSGRTAAATRRAASTGVSSGARCSRRR